MADSYEYEDQGARCPECGTETQMEWCEMGDGDYVLAFATCPECGWAESQKEAEARS